MNTQLTYTIDQVSKLTGLGRTKIYDELKNGKLKGVKCDRRTLVTHTSLVEWSKNLQPYEAGPEDAK